MAWSWNVGGARAGDRQMRLRRLMKLQDGIPVSESVPHAPPREALHAFGGPLPLGAFRAVGRVEVLQEPLVGQIHNELEILVAGGVEARKAYTVVPNPGRRRTAALE